MWSSQASSAKRQSHANCALKGLTKWELERRKMTGTMLMECLRKRLVISWFSYQIAILLTVNLGRRDFIDREVRQVFVFYTLNSPSMSSLKLSRRDYLPLKQSLISSMDIYQSSLYILYTCAIYLIYTLGMGDIKIGSSRKKPHDLFSLFISDQNAYLAQT